MFSAAGTTATLRFVSWWGAFVVGRRHTGQRRAVSHWRRTSLRTRCADEKRQGAVEEEAVDEEEEQEVVVEERAREPLLVFRDDFKMMPGLMPSTVTFKEERTVQKPASEKESFPREGREHKRLLGPGTAVLSSLMCGGYGYLAWLVRASPLPSAPERRWGWKADPRELQDWILKGQQGGCDHALAACRVATLCCSPPALATDTLEQPLLRKSILVLASEAGRSAGDQQNTASGGDEDARRGREYKPGENRCTVHVRARGACGEAPVVIIYQRGRSRTNRNAKVLRVATENGLND
jgi:hypothetical protein